MTINERRYKLTPERMQEIKNRVNATLKDYDFYRPPVDPKKIISDISTIYEFNHPEEIGFTSYIDGTYKVYINKVGFQGMTTWTYGHELAHILLFHFHKSKELLSSEIGCKLLEDEANFFTAELLMPEHWIRDAVKLYNPNTRRNLGKLKELFKVSWASLMNRLDNLGIQLKTHSENILQNNQFNNSFIFPADSNGRFFKCIECGNARFSPDARFCKLCGTFLFNACGDTKAEDVECGASVSPDARYCEYCGNETLLMKKFTQRL